MKSRFFRLLFCGILLFEITGCADVLSEKKNVSYDDLYEINNIIIEYFTENSVADYENYSYNYVDEKNKVVVVGLLDNSKEKQAEFKEIVVNSDLIKFEKAERMVNE